MVSEKKLQSYLMDRAKMHNIYCRKVMAVGRTGFPDLFLAKNGRVILIEVKSPTGKGRLSQKQIVEIERIQNAGLKVFVVEKFSEVDKVFQQILDTSTD